MPPDAVHQTAEMNALSHNFFQCAAIFGFQNQKFGYGMCIDNGKITFEVRKRSVQRMVKLRLKSDDPISETYKRQDYENPELVNLLFSIFFNNASYAEQIRKHEFLFPLLYGDRPVTHLNWYELLDRMILLISDHFTGTSLSENLTTSSHAWQPLSGGLAESIPPLPHLFSTMFTTRKTPVPQQNLSGRGTRATTTFNHQVPPPAVVRSKDLSDIPQAKLLEWQNMHLQHFCKTRNPSPDDEFLVKGDKTGKEEVEKETATFDYHKEGSHMHNFFAAQLESHRGSAGINWNQKSITKYFKKTMKTVEKAQQNVLQRWAMNPMTDEKEYYDAIAQYVKNLEDTNESSVESAKDGSRKRIQELLKQSGEKSLILSRAYIFAMSTMTPALARQINGVLSYQDQPGLFERLESYFGQRYAVEMLRAQ